MPSTTEERYTRFWWRIHPPLRERIELHIANARKLHGLHLDPPINPNNWRDREWIRTTAGYTKTQLLKDTAGTIKTQTLRRWETGPVKLQPQLIEPYTNALSTIALQAAEEHLAYAATNLWEADRGGTTIHEHIPENDDLIEWLNNEQTAHTHMLDMTA